MYNLWSFSFDFFWDNNEPISEEDWERVQHRNKFVWRQVIFLSSPAVTGIYRKTEKEQVSENLFDVSISFTVLSRNGISWM